MNRLEELVLDRVNQYLMAEFDCETEPASYGLRGSRAIDAQGQQFHLYIRILARDGFWPNLTMVIVNIGFLKQRSGHGRKFIDFLKLLTKDIGFQYIGIENTNRNSAAFAEKLEFERYPDRYNYIMKVF
jgi:hypothetical protein